MNESEPVEIQLDDGVAIARIRVRNLSEPDAAAIELVLCQAARSGMHLAIDLSMVDVLASAGIAALLAAKHEAVARGGAMMLFGVNQPVLAMLELTALLREFPTAPDRAEAVSRLRARQEPDR